MEACENSDFWKCYVFFAAVARSVTHIAQPGMNAAVALERYTAHSLTSHAYISTYAYLHTHILIALTRTHCTTLPVRGIAFSAQRPALALGLYADLLKRFPDEIDLKQQYVNTLQAVAQQGMPATVGSLPTLYFTHTHTLTQ